MKFNFDRAKNVLGMFGYLFMSLFPWGLFLWGFVTHNVFYALVGGIFIILNKLDSIEKLLISLSTAFVLLLQSKKDIEKEEDEEKEKVDRESMFR